MTTIIETLITNWNIKAVIFDLDGTLIDNNAYHILSWKQYLKNIGKDISEDEFKKNMNGRTNKDAAEYIYGRKLSDEEAMKYALEKEAIYREMYKPHIRPLDGLLPLLSLIKKMDLPMAIATSGIQVNIDFMFDNIPIKDYFDVVINSSHITKGKPDPEIYLTTASKLNIAPGNCLVFEDAVVGVKSAKDAGMHVIGITTTQSADELKIADKVISGYKELMN